MKVVLRKVLWSSNEFLPIIFDILLSKCVWILQVRFHIIAAVLEVICPINLTVTLPQWFYGSGIYPQQGDLF